MQDQQDWAVRRTRALVAASQRVCALSDLVMRQSQVTIDQTAALLAEPRPSPFLQPAPWRVYR